MEVDQRMLLELSEVPVIECLLESSSMYPLDILDTDPYPSDLTLAQFAELVYTEKKLGESDEAYGERLILPEGWRLLLTSSNPDWTNGYFGTAFVHTGLQQVVVAHRGTTPSKVGPLYTDFIGIFMNKHTSCMNSAVTFVDHVRQVIHDVNSAPHERHYNLTITGHSLGGWLAQVTTFTAKYVKVSNGALVENTSGGVHSKTVVFDSPGVKDMLYKIQDKHYTRYGTDFLDRLDNLDITVYVSVPNRINTCGAHLRTVYRVFIDFSKYGWEDMETSYNAKTHAIGNFVEAFKKSSPNISEVLDWAKDSNEYSSLFKSQTLKQTSEYNVGLENNKTGFYFEELKKRYQVIPQPSDEITVKSNLNVFSEDELKILEYLNIIQNEMYVRVLDQFILSQKLQINTSKLFPSFKINHKNRTIICESKHMLEELTKRVKQLVRWLGPQFSKAVKEQIETFSGAVDSFYRAEGRSFLNSLPKSLMNFTDSIGLRKFLLSDTAQVLAIITQDGAFEMTRLQNLFSQIKESFNSSHPINKYTCDSHYTFLDWQRLQKLLKIDGSPINQNNLILVDGSLRSTTCSDLVTFLNNYVRFSPTNLKKLVFISTHPIDIFNSFDNIETFIADRRMNLLDLSDESQLILLGRHLISIGNTVTSFQDFLGESCSISEINQFVCSDYFKKIATNKDYTIVIKDTRPKISDLQMPIIKTNIVTSKEHVLHCVDLANSLVVICGLNCRDLETGAGWEQLAGKEVIFAEGDIELSFKDTCNQNQNQHKTIYLFEVSGDVNAEVHCKQIFNRGFYVPRKFFHRAYINIQKLSEAKLADDVFVICSEEHKATLLGLIENREKREEISNNIQISDSKKGDEDIIQNFFHRNIHFVNIQQHLKSYKLDWSFSHGSVENLLPCLSTNSLDPLDELTLSRTDRNLVIITDEPGMGKTTTLANLSRLIETAWVIHIELKQFKSHIHSLSGRLTPQNVSTFLLSDCHSGADSSLVQGLLEYILQSKTCSKRVVLMFDGFDELDDYIKHKDSSKDKLVKLFHFLQRKPMVQVFLTARKYLKESLETKLSQFSTSFVTINIQEQQDFLFKFWRSFLPLELGIKREEVEWRLKEYAGEVLRRAKQVLGLDMDCFMGIPLQLRMLAEVFRPQRDLLIQSLEVLNEQINIVSAPNLYKMFITLKYDIYLNDKTLIGSVLDEDETLKQTKSFTKVHGELGFRTFFPEFFDLHKEYFKDICEKKLVKLNRLGLIQSKKNGEFQFIHRTYAEYCCAQMVVHWLNRQPPIIYQLIKDIIFPKILLHPDSKIIRLFFNVELEDIAMSKTTLQLNAEHIRRLWFEKKTIFTNEEHQTALHIAVQERNEHIMTLLLSGLTKDSNLDVFVSYITQYDFNNDTALHLIDKPAFRTKPEDYSICNRLIYIIFEYIETCSNETKEDILFACLFNRDISESYVSNYLLKSGKISGNTLAVFNKILTRVKKVSSEVSSVKDALLTNNIKLAKKILSHRLKPIERYCSLLVKHEEQKIALHLAVQRGNFGVVKLLAEQFPDLFTIMMIWIDHNKMTPLHTAAECGHLDIVELLVKYGADINIRCKLGRTSVMYAASYQHTSIVKYLIENGAEIDSTDNYGRTALYIAAGKDNLPTVKYLIEKGADINSRDNDGWSPLHIAAGNRKLSMVKYLIEWSAEISCKDNGGKTALHIAAVGNNSLSIVKHLVESGTEINSKDNDGRTALDIARDNDNLLIVNYLIEREADIHSGENNDKTAHKMVRGDEHFTIVNNLIESGADINSEDNDCKNALHIAGGIENLSIVYNSVENGADINSDDNNGRTAHPMARGNDNLTIVNNLTESDAEINSVNNNLWTELQTAASNNDLSRVKCLIESGAQIHFNNFHGSPVLHIAAGNNNLSMVKYLIESGAEINCKNNYGWTALYIAVSKDYLPLSKYLIESGAEIYGSTSLHVAAKYSNLSLVKYILESGAQTNAKDDDGWTALHIAAGIDSLIIFKYLYENSADMKAIEIAVLLHIAVRNNILSIVKYLIKNGAEINSKDNDGWTALHIAARKDSLSLVKYLIESGADINSEVNDGMTALHIAVVYNKHLSIVKYIIENGGVISSNITSKGVTALHIATCKDNLPILKYLFESSADNNSSKIAVLLHIAVSNNNVSSVKYLIEIGADINAGGNSPYISLPISYLLLPENKDSLTVTENITERRLEIISKDDNDGRSALHIAADKNYLNMVKYLIDSGAKINGKDDDGSTALHIAAGKNYISILQYLIESGAEINCKDYDGMTALHIAVRNNMLSLVQYLIKIGVEINPVNNDGETALLIAVQRGYLSVVEYLLQKGADPDMVDACGETALTEATRGKKWDLVSLLLNGGADVKASGSVVLLKAIGWRKWNIVEYLVEKEVSVLESEIPTEYLSDFKRKFPNYKFKFNTIMEKHI